jgi:hypothetical protein
VTYSFVPPAGPRAEVAELQVSARGAPSSRARLEVGLALPKPARLVLRAPGAPVSADGRTPVAVEVRLLDAEGLGLSGYPVRLTAAGAAVPLEDRG